MKVIYLTGWLFILCTSSLHSVLYGQAYVLNGSATSLGNECYQLTPDVGGLAGSFFSENTIDLTQPFSLDARLFFGCKDGSGADGIVFILATSNTALGTGGGGIGYQGITPSIAVEYDDYFNGEFADPAPDHMAIISMGAVEHNVPTNLAGPETISNIEDCSDHCFTINWNPTSLTLTAILDGNSISYTGDIVTNIFSGNPLVYYGFSSGTGGLSNTHRVCFGPPTLVPLADVSVCEGKSVELEADPNGIAWTWAPDPTLSPLNISNPTATPSITTTYTTIIEYLCGYFLNDTVIVNVSPSPVVTASNNGPVCIGESVSLMANGGTSYLWSGPSGFSSSIQNPLLLNMTIGKAGIYAVTVTDASGCTAVTTTLVDVDPGPMIMIDLPQLPVCEQQDPFQLTASPNGGTWSGEISMTGLFDPGAAGTGSNLITYTATNSAGCSNSAQINIEVLANPEVLIDPPGILCADGSPIQMTASPPWGFWTGTISFDGIFNPVLAGDGPHLITYHASDINDCSGSAQIVVEVASVIPADILPTGPFCVTDPAIQLMATPSGGQWGGVANNAGIINPDILGPGIHQITYTFQNQFGCYYNQQDIEILNTPMVTINAIGPLCNNLSSQILTASPAGGAWSGVANPAGQIDPLLLGPGIHEVIYTFSLPGGCSDADTLDVIILPDAPMINNLNLLCDSVNTSYVVSFTISGGDPTSYTIQSSFSGILIPGSPYTFTSEPIPSGDPYSFVIYDINNCDSVTITGSYLCNCTTDAGAMDLTMITVCADDTINVLLPTGNVLDPDDSLLYILHLGIPNSTILTSSSNQFVFGPPLQTGITYFVSTIAGNALAGSGIDLTDPCLSVSSGTPIMWVEPPSGFLTGPSRICRGESATISFILSGGGPFDVQYVDESGMHWLDSILSGHMLTFTPTNIAFFNLVNITDRSFPGCVSTVDTGLMIEVKDIFIVQQSKRLCLGDSILLSGSFQSQAGMYLDTLHTVFGCDSILETSLTVAQLDTTILMHTSCDSAQTGEFVVIQSNEYGCDSTIITTITYALADTTHLFSVTCDILESGIYTEQLTSQYGCDSLVIETVDFIKADTTYLSDATCDAVSAGVFINSLFNSKGCDSIIIETINLLPSDTFSSYLMTCLPQDTGTNLLVYTNEHGCDSIIFIITALAPYDSCHEVIVPINIFVPTVFSPNGDGQNDLFMIFANQESISQISYFRIFDRWGGLVFERSSIQPNDTDGAWDGREKGKLLGPGVFLWIAEIDFEDGTTTVLSGDVTLLR